MRVLVGGGGEGVKETSNPKQKGRGALVGYYYYYYFASSSMLTVIEGRILRDGFGLPNESCDGHGGLIASQVR